MAAVGRRDSFMNNSIPLCVFLLIIMMSANSCKAITNVLLAGQKLDWQNKLSYANSQVSLVMKFNCNLVLYDDKGHVQWESKTGGFLPWYCTLSFTDNGRLVITDNSGEQYWISSNANSKVGQYVAVLRPEGQLFIYGPAIWAVGEPSAVKESSISSSSSSSDINNNEMVSSMTNLKKIPPIDNVLFSGQILNDGGKISDKGYSFILDECELIVKDSQGKNTWQTWTHGNGKNCFARLDYSGGLSIFDEQNTLVWKNEVALTPPYGEYALVMQSDGTATIYGPDVWSSLVIPRDGLIKMPTVMM